MAGARHDETHPFALLSEPSWATTAIQYVKDVLSLQEARVKVLGPKGRGKKGEETPIKDQTLCKYIQERYQCPKGKPGPSCCEAARL